MLWMRKTVAGKKASSDGYKTKRDAASTIVVMAPADEIDERASDASR